MGIDPNVAHGAIRLSLSRFTTAAEIDQTIEAAHEALSEEQWAEAETLYTEALAMNARSHECLYGRAIARHRQNQLPDALEDIDRALALHDSPDYYQVRALIFRKLGREEEAASDEAMSRVLRAPPP